MSLYYPQPPEEPGCAHWLLYLVAALIQLGHIACAIAVAGTVHDAGHGWALTALSAVGSYVVTWCLVWAATSFLAWFFTPGRP